MIAINHALTGAVIGLSVGNPWLAVPAAFVSHFVCDALPHYGWNDNNRLLASTYFKVQLIVDALLCVALVITLFLLGPDGWLLASICAFVATVPDFAWLPGYMRTLVGKPWKSAKQSAFMTFTAKMQWFERPIGLIVELAWATGALVVLWAYL